jgi:hypothetical protein
VRANFKFFGGSYCGLKFSNFYAEGRTYGFCSAKTVRSAIALKEAQKRAINRADVV